MAVPRVSVITATFNSGKTLKSCLDSVASQSCLSFIEHIVIDGRSRDNTLSIVSEYSHISKVISESDRGIYHAFNKGVEVSNGEIIYFLNSDDEFASPDIIEKVLKAMKCDDMYLCGRIVVIDDVSNAQIISAKYSEPHFKPKHQAFFARREVFEKIGPFNECFTIAADGYFMHKAVRDFSGTFIDDVICKFRKGGISSLDNNLHKLTEEYKLINALLDIGSSRRSIDEINVNLKRKNTALVTLIARISSDGFEMQRFNEKRIAIFGFRDLSVVVNKLLKLKKIDVECFIATHLLPDPIVDSLPVLNFEQAASLGINLVINCIEGAHELDVNQLITQNLPCARVISWRDL